MFGIFSKKRKPKNALEQLIFALYGNPPPPRGRANLSEAVDQAYSELLIELISYDEVEEQAKEHFESEIPFTTHDLALSTALSFFKEARNTSKLAQAQLFARMTILGWLNEGLVHPEFVKSFEDDLYTLYK